MICKHILMITFLNEPEHISLFFDFEYFYPKQIILLTINHLFAHS